MTICPVFPVLSEKLPMFIPNNKNLLALLENLWYNLSGL
jgi:hypothetical protein